MAQTAISTNEDLLERYPTIEAELLRLHPGEQGRADHWSKLHKAAWRRILQDLSLRSPSIAEDDLTSPGQFVDAALYWVMHLAYLAGEGDADRAEARRWESRYRSEMAEQKAQTSSGERGPGEMDTRLVRR